MTAIHNLVRGIREPLDTLLLTRAAVSLRDRALSESCFLRRLHLARRYEVFKLRANRCYHGFVWAVNFGSHRSPQLAGLVLQH